MEILSQLTKTTQKPSRRVGRGYGSKKGGHTTGRGAKGDKVRGKTKITFDGTKIKKGWIKRTPFLRGKHRVLAKTKCPYVSLTLIDKWFKESEEVTLNVLAEKMGFPKENLPAKIKILSAPKFAKKLSFVSLSFSSKAKDQILAAGGKID